MIAFEFSLEIARPVEEVFAYLADPAALPDWQSTAVHVEQASPGPMAAGTRLRERRRFLGREGESEVEVTEYEPGRRLTVRAVSGPVPFTVDHRLEPADGGTLLHVAAHAEPGRALRLAGPMVARAAERQFRADFQRLKEILER